MQAGKLDRRITIIGKTISRDDYGAEIVSWATRETVWARYLPGGGNERFAAAQVYAETQGRFQIRWRTDVTTDNRILFDGKEWDILDVCELGRREGIEMKAKARA